MKNNSKARFFKEIEYSSDSWRRDFIFGQTGIPNHGHIGLSGSTTLSMIGGLSGSACQEAIIGLSGASTVNRIIGSENIAIQYLRDEKNDNIIRKGKPVSEISPNNCEIINQTL